MRNTDTLTLVADFLGIQPSALKNALSYKTKIVKKELYTVFLDPDRASNNHDDLAKTLYSLLFSWLNKHINQRVCRDDFETFIGLFDLPGPQNMTGCPNSLNQFCINFTNERLHHFIQRCLFEAHMDEYKSEGIASLVPPIPYFNNSECLCLLQNRPGGLIHIMDDQACCSHKIAEEDQDDKDAAQHGDAGASDTGASGAGAPCVAGKFRAALDTLFDTLSKTQTWYILCINPNDVRLPNQLEGHAVKMQVRSAGLGAVVAQCGGGSTGAKGRMWKVGIEIGEFWQRRGNREMGLHAQGQRWGLVRWIWSWVSSR